jgi:hypothetical protein
MLPIFYHDSTGDAYDASNCRDDHARAIVIIESENVVGLAWAWPLAVTAETGELHATREGMDRTGILSLLADAGYSENDVQEAIDAAKVCGFGIRREFLIFDRNLF